MGSSQDIYLWAMDECPHVENFSSIQLSHPVPVQNLQYVPPDVFSQLHWHVLADACTNFHVWALPSQSYNSISPFGLRSDIGFRLIDKGQWQGISLKKWVSSYRHFLHLISPNKRRLLSSGRGWFWLLEGSGECGFKILSLLFPNISILGLVIPLFYYQVPSILRLGGLPLL